MGETKDKAVAAAKKPAAKKKPGKKAVKAVKKPVKKPVKDATKLTEGLKPVKVKVAKPAPVQMKRKKKSVKGGRVRFGKPVLKPNTFIEKPIGGEKNGGTRLVPVKKKPAYYATQLNAKKMPKQIKNHKRPMRSSLTPGTVCILLAGIHRGKKVVLLKELAGGLCLITGPFKINACPLRRVNQIYLVATSTKIDLGNVGIPKHINDKYFRRVKANRAKKEEGDIFEQKQEKYVASAKRKRDQAVVDGNIVAAIRKREDKKFLFGYLGTPFGLRNRQYPHRMKF